MQVMRFLFFYLMVSLLGVLVLVFLGLNHYTIQLDLIRGEYSVNVAVVMVGAAAFGFVLALLALLPGRIATTINTRALKRDVRMLERLLSDREDLLADQEDLLADQEEMYADVLNQHERLLERHERMLARHEALLDDYSVTVAERDEARRQLAALRLPRPAIASHTSGAAALRLLPPTAPAPARVAQPAYPAVPVPVARVASPVPVPAPAPAAAQPTQQTKQPAQRPARPVTSGPWRLKRTVTPEPEPATVPVVSASPIPATSPAPAPSPALPAIAASAAVVTPAGETPASAPVTVEEKELSATPEPRRNMLAELRERAIQAREATGARLVSLRQTVQQRAGVSWTWIATQSSTQSKALLAQAQQLQRRVTSMLASEKADAGD